MSDDAQRADPAPPQATSWISIPPTEGYTDPVIAVYRQHVDRSLLRENLKLTPQQRLEKFQRHMAFLAKMREAGKRLREER